MPDTLPKSLADVKAGDKLILEISSYDRRVVSVARRTATQVLTSDGTRYSLRTRRRVGHTVSSQIRFPVEGELEQLAAEEAASNAEAERRAAAARERRAQPGYQATDFLRGLDCQSVEQLRARYGDALLIEVARKLGWETNDASCAIVCAEMFMRYRHTAS